MGWHSPLSVGLNTKIGISARSCGVRWGWVWVAWEINFTLPRSVHAVDQHLHCPMSTHMILFLNADKLLSPLKLGSTLMNTHCLPLINLSLWPCHKTKKRGSSLSFSPLEPDPIRGFDFPLTPSELAVAIFLTLDWWCTTELGVRCYFVRDKVEGTTSHTVDFLMQIHFHLAFSSGKCKWIMKEFSGLRSFWLHNMLW